MNALDALNKIARPLGWNFLSVTFEDGADRYPQVDLDNYFRGMLFVTLKVRCPCGQIEHAVCSVSRDFLEYEAGFARYICDRLLNREHIEEDVKAGRLPPSALEAWDRAVERVT